MNKPLSQRLWFGVDLLFLTLGTLPGNEKSQRLAERIGFVKAGTINVVFGLPPDEELISGAVGFVLPGMEWTDGRTIYPTRH